MRVIRVLVFEGPSERVLTTLLNSLVAPGRPFESNGLTITEIARAEKVWENGDDQSKALNG